MLWKQPFCGYVVGLVTIGDFAEGLEFDIRKNSVREELEDIGDDEIAQ